MKKSKLFILLPLVTLCLSSCDAIFGSTSSGSSSASSEASESTSYDSYSLDFTFLYRGNVETISSDASLYFYSDLTDNSFKALTANGDSYRLTLENVAYGSYTYTIYIEYLDSSVSSASPLVDAGQITVDSSASSYGKQVNLNSPLAEILGEKSDSEKTDYTYTIEVDNANALSALTYDGNSATQTSVALEIYLVTTPDNGNPERTKASVGDVRLSNYSESVITIDGLTVTPVSSGSTSITVSRDGYISTSVNVIVIDITDTGESGGSGDSGTGGDSGESGGSGDTGAGGDSGESGGSGDSGTGGDLNSDGTASITLNITIYASDGSTSLKVPDDCVVYIAGDFDVHDDSDGYWWNLDSNSAITLASSDNGVYLYTYETTVTPGQSNYHFKLLLVENGTEYDWYTYTIYDSYFDAPVDIVNGGSITLQCITEYTSDLSEAFGDEGGEGGDDNPNTGDEGAATIENYTIVFTFYDTNGDVQKCPAYGTLYMQGNFADPTSGNWGSYLELSETTDLSGNTAYAYTFDQLVPGALYTFNVVFANQGESPSWNPVKGDGNFNAVLFSTTNDGDTEYVSLTGCYNFDSQFGLKTNSCTIAVNDTAHTGKSLMISGDMQGWTPTAMTYDASGTDYQYSYTFDVSENQALEFGIYTLSTWADSIQLAQGYTHEYVTETGSNLKVEGAAIGSNTYTLIVFTVDGTNFGVSGADHVRASAITITH